MKRLRAAALLATVAVTSEWTQNSGFDLTANEGYDSPNWTGSGTRRALPPARRGRDR